MITPYFLENFWVGGVFFFILGVYAGAVPYYSLAVLPSYHVHVSEELRFIHIVEETVCFAGLTPPWLSVSVAAGVAGQQPRRHR